MTISAQREIATSLERKDRRWPLIWLKQQPVATCAVLILLVFVIIAIFANYLAPYGPNQPTTAYFNAPSRQFPFGTDNLGRDIFSRVMYGSRTSLVTGVLSVMFGTTAGVVVGIVAGYVGGIVDLLVQRIIDILMSLPGILLALVVAAGLGASLLNVSFAIALALLPVSARIARGSTLSVRAAPYVEAARATGATWERIVSRHIVPNVAAPVLVIGSVQLGFAILAEASLSYLGLGIPLGMPSWGNMLGGSTLLYIQRAPWMGIAPGIALSLVVLAANLLGDALRDRLDPRLRGATQAI